MTRRSQCGGLSPRFRPRRIVRVADWKILNELLGVICARSFATIACVEATAGTLGQ
jgi:hypothetical protein